MTPTCSDCGKGLRSHGKAKRCLPCHTAFRKPTPKTCRDCGAPVGPCSRGRCKPCAQHWVANDPEMIRKRADGVRRRFKDPAYRAKMTTIITAANERARQRPEHMAYLRARGQELAALMNSPEVMARRMAMRHEVGAKYTERFLGWCPPAYRDEYRRLRSGKGAAVARRMIEEMIAARFAEMTPFERQLHALRNGARLVEMPAKGAFGR
jgi:hypothetical protein